MLSFELMAIPRITKEDLQAKLDGDAAAAPVILDARLKYPYEHSTVKLPGAVRVVPPDFDLSSVPRDREVVVYDSDPQELVSTRVAAQLIREGCQASALSGGIEEWMAAKLQTETKDAPKQKPPVAGALKG